MSLNFFVVLVVGLVVESLNCSHTVTHQNFFIRMQRKDECIQKENLTEQKIYFIMNLKEEI